MYEIVRAGYTRTPAIQNLFCMRCAFCIHLYSVVKVMFVTTIQFMLDYRQSNTTHACMFILFSFSLINTQSAMFNADWQLMYFFFENISGKPQCFICSRQLAKCDKFHIRRHYLSCHIEYEKYDNEKRKMLLDELKFKAPISFTQNPVNNSSHNQTLRASYVVSLALAKQCRPKTDGAFIKNVCEDILKCFGEKGEEMASLISWIPLSEATITRRTAIISDFIFMGVKKRLQECSFFSISLDESTDITNTSQLIIYLKTVHENLVIHEDFLALVSMHGHVNGQTLWEAVNENVFMLGDKQKLSAVCTDGARVMLGKNKGFIGHLSQEIDVPSFHCIIHQQALFSKHLCFHDAMKICVQIINEIRGGHNALTHRKFKMFLEEVEADYGDLLMFTEVRWLSRGRSLDRFFELRSEILEFLAKENLTKYEIFLSHLRDNVFLIRLAYLSDVCNLINELNLALQGENKNIFDLYPLINHFKRKIGILNNQIKNKDIKSLPKTVSLNLPIPDSLLLEFTSVNDNILNNIENRFEDFNKIAPIIDLHNNTFACELQNQSPEIQLEIKQMLDDVTLPLSAGNEFWKQVSRIKYPNSTTAIYKLYSMFASTYNCEKAFSILKIIKSKSRNKLLDSNLQQLMRIKLHKEQINIDQLLSMDVP